MPRNNAKLSLLIVVLLIVGTTAWSAGSPSLKDAYKDYFFYVGAAINRMVATGVSAQALRTSEQLAKDVALVKEQFNQISPENDLKWALIHPREGANGYDFGPADAYVARLDL